MASNVRPVEQGDDEDDQQDTPVQALEKERSATIIQGYYQRYRRRREGGAGGPQYIAYDRQAAMLVGKAPLGSRPVQYAMHLRGPLPHFAVCVDRMLEQCQHIVDRLQKTMLTIGHERLDDVMLERQRAL